MLIDKINWKGFNDVEWALENGQTVKRTLKFRPSSVVLLHDRSGVMIIESVKESAPSNLVIIDSDGHERFRPGPPVDPNRTYGFCYGGYESGILVVVLSTTGDDLAYTFDPITGKFGNGVPRR